MEDLKKQKKAEYNKRAREKKKQKEEQNEVKEVKVKEEVKANEFIQHLEKMKQMKQQPIQQPIQQDNFFLDQIKTTGKMVAENLVKSAILTLIPLGIKYGISKISVKNTQQEQEKSQETLSSLDMTAYKYSF